jgi:FkbM family methyltransferase
MARLNNFTAIESIYGKFIVNRHCAFQAEYLIKFGVPHIQPELKGILQIASMLPEGAIALDAGANIGLVSVPLGQMLKPRRGRVYAFEAQRMMFYALCGSAALNDLDNLHVFNQALGAGTGKVSLPVPDYGKAQDFGLFSLTGGKAPLQNNPNGEVESVEITTVDGLQLPRLDFMKVDVEGMEIEVLKGASRSVRANEPWVWIEHWLAGIDAIKGQFADLPYTFYRMDDLNMLCVPTRRAEQVHFRTDAPTA